MLERTFIPHRLLSRQAFGQFAVFVIDLDRLEQLCQQPFAILFLDRLVSLLCSQSRLLAQRLEL